MAKRDNETTRTNGGTTTTNASGATTADEMEQRGSKRNPATTAALGKTEERSGGVVHAPGKKHRKPMPTYPSATMRVGVLPAWALRVRDEEPSETGTAPFANG